MADTARKLSVEERLDIIDLFSRYYWGLDLGDADLAASCYAKEGVFHHLWQGKVQGRENLVRAFHELWYDRPTWWFARQHRLSNHVMTRQGEDVFVKAMFSIVQRSMYYHTNFVFGLGTVEVLLTQEDGEWKFKNFYINAWNQPQDVPWQGDERAYDPRLPLPSGPQEETR
jgi:SnoaL-like domain